MIPAWQVLKFRFKHVILRRETAQNKKGTYLCSSVVENTLALEQLDSQYECEKDGGLWAYIPALFGQSWHYLEKRSKLTLTSIIL
jgi:hypothetical protein